MRYILFPVCLFITLSLSAQVNNNGMKGKVKYTRTGNSNDYTCLLPEFYTRFPKYDKDTTWKFELYDSRDSIINIDTVQDINIVRYFSLFKSFTDSAHTYKDSNGKDQLMPVSSIIHRYDKTGDDKWISINYTNNKYTELREYKQDIVKTDTVIIVDPITGKEQSIFYKYYKVIPIK